MSLRISYITSTYPAPRMAKNLEDVVKIQTEFMSHQLDSFNEQTKTLMEICTKATKEATQRSN